MKKFMLPLAVLAATAAHAEMPNVNWSGDFRYRHENIDSWVNTDHNIQERIRARLQAKSDVTDSVSVRARITSGSNSITTTNQTLDGAGANKALEIDIFQASWKAADGVNVHLGKMANPMYTVGSSDIVFDSDITPEGIAISYEKGMFFANLGRFWIKNETDNANDVMLYAPQAGVNLTTGPVKLTVGASWYNYTGMNRNVGNATKGNTSTTAEFKVLNGFVNASGKTGEIGYSVYFDYIKNSEVDNNDMGWLAGTKLSYKSWSLTYDYRWVDADATLDIFPDGDTAGSSGGTNIYGHRTKLGYKITKNISTDLAYYTHTYRSNKRHYDKYMIDLVFKF